MRRHITLSIALLGLSMTWLPTAAPAQNWLGVAAIIDAELDYGSRRRVNDTTECGFMLSYGRQWREQLAWEASYVRYLDFNTQAGLLREDISAWELSALLQPRALPGFLRLGYTLGHIPTHSNLVDVGYDEKGGTLLYGLGVELPLAYQSGDRPGGKLRLGYAIADYGRGEIRRLTLGSLAAF